MGEQRKRHRRLPQVCREQGHIWKQEVWGVLGFEECARRNCDERRVSPKAIPDRSAS
jgi:hypothetical protein